MTLDIAESVVRSWTSLYTKGLGTDLGAARRAEVESDLWEQGHIWREHGFSGLSWQLLGRWLLGIPSDVSWRLEQIVTRKETASKAGGKLERTIKLHTTVTQKSMFGFIVLLAGFFLVMGPVSAIFGGGDDWDPSGLERGVMGTVPVVAGLMILGGLFLMSQSPHLAAGLLATGTVLMALLWFWLFFIGIPLVIFMIWYGVSQARKVGRDRDPPETGA